MAPMFDLPASLVAKIVARDGALHKVLDVAAGHGLLRIHAPCSARRTSRFRIEQRARRRSREREE